MFLEESVLLLNSSRSKTSNFRWVGLAILALILLTCAIFLLDDDFHPSNENLGASVGEETNSCENPITFPADKAQREATIKQICIDSYQTDEERRHCRILTRSAYHRNPIDTICEVRNLFKLWSNDAQDDLREGILRNFEQKVREQSRAAKLALQTDQELMASFDQSQQPGQNFKYARYPADNMRVGWEAELLMYNKEHEQDPEKIAYSEETWYWPDEAYTTYGSSIRKQTPYICPWEYGSAPFIIFSREPNDAEITRKYETMAGEATRNGNYQFLPLDFTTLINFTPEEHCEIELSTPARPINPGLTQFPSWPQWAKNIMAREGPILQRCGLIAIQKFRDYIAAGDSSQNLQNVLDQMVQDSELKEVCEAKAFRYSFNELLHNPDDSPLKNDYDLAIWGAMIPDRSEGRQPYLSFQTNFGVPLAFLDPTETCPDDICNKKGVQRLKYINNPMNSADKDKIIGTDFDEAYTAKFGSPNSNRDNMLKSQVQSYIGSHRDGFLKWVEFTRVINSKGSEAEQDAVNEKNFQDFMPKIHWNEDNWGKARFLYLTLFPERGALSPSTWDGFQRRLVNTKWNQYSTVRMPGTKNVLVAVVENRSDRDDSFASNLFKMQLNPERTMDLYKSEIREVFNRILKLQYHPWQSYNHAEIEACDAVDFKICTWTGDSWDKATWSANPPWNCDGSIIPACT